LPFITLLCRIYAIYTCHADNMRTVKNDQEKLITRVDILGKLMLKHSDQ